MKPASNWNRKLGLAARWMLGDCVLSKDKSAFFDLIDRGYQRSKPIPAGFRPDRLLI